MKLSREVETLDNLARGLKLTEKQRMFADRIAVHPGQRGTKMAAALAVGAPASSAASLATKWLKMEKVQKYIAEVRDLARRRAIALGAKVPLNPQASSEAAVAEIAEVMTVLTTQMRSRIGDYITADGRLNLEAVRAAPFGVIVGLELETGKIRMVDAKGAASRLLDYYTDVPAPPTGAHREFHERFAPQNLPPDVLAHIDQARAALIRAMEPRVIGSGSTKEGGRG